MSDARPAISIQPILADDLDTVSTFLSEHLNSRVSAQSWKAVIDPPWGERGPNRGFQLISDGAIVGAYLAVYSTRRRDDQEVAVCNLAAFFVAESFRAHSLRLLRAMLAQKDYLFTDLSPSGSVPALNERLGFKYLDTNTRLVVNFGLRTNRLVDDPKAIEALLSGEDAVIYRDHRDAPASRHLVVQLGDRYAYLLYRRDRRKRLSVFATPLYVGGDATLLRDSWSQVASYLSRRGLLATLAERRVLGFTAPGLGRNLARPRPKMFKGSGLDAVNVDYLYSEMTLLEW